jgi:acetyl esterase/lipase
MKKFAPLVLAFLLVLGFIVVQSSVSASAEITATVNYASTSDKDQTMDVYSPETTSTDYSSVRGAWIAVFHGGSWSAGSKLNTDKASQKFADQGFKVFNVAYRLTTDYNGNPGAPWPAQRDDGITAINYIKSHALEYDIDPNRGAVYGFSAGGHIAMEVGLYGNTRNVEAIVSASGVLQPHRVQDVADSHPDVGHGGDFPTVANKTLARWEAVAMRCPRLTTWYDCNARWLDFMPETHISPNDPPVWMTQGTADESVPWGTGKAFQYWLNRQGIRNTLIEGVNWGHTDALAFDGGTREASMMAFLKKETA